MPCGCKNKANQQTQQAQQVQAPQTQQQGGNVAETKSSVQENVKKVISKYYRR
jgi:hypothetical protein